MPIMRIDGIVAALSWLHGRGARGLCSDSRRLRPGDAFIAWPGHAHDARLQVNAALAAGALACIVEAQGVEQFAFEDKPTIAAVAGLKDISGVKVGGYSGEDSPGEKAGMQPGDASPIPATLLAARHLLYDTIYTSARTPLMRAADTAGARSANGLSMLLHQGALSFEHWFHRPAPLEVMRAALNGGAL